MNARSLARVLGGDVVSPSQVVCPGPGHSPKDRSLAVFIDWQAPDGFRVHPHAPGDDWRVCRDYVRDRLGLPRSTGPQTSCRSSETSSPPNSCSSTRSEPARVGSDTDRTARALALWQEAVDPRGTLVEAYLDGRGLPLPAEAAGEAIRFHPACPFKLDDGSTLRLPAMMGLMREIITDEPCGVHRTALKADGSGKADMPDGTNPKKMLGRARGAVVKLSSDEAVLDGLGIAEGIETALTALCAGWRPMWAALSAGAIADFPVLSGIGRLTIFADADPSGHVAAQECQSRWRSAGLECPIVLPPADGTDWNEWRAA